MPIVAVNGADTNSAGIIIYWTLSGEIDYEVLSAAWEAAGLDQSLLPGTPSSIVALQRAMRDCAASNEDVRPVRNADAYVIVREKYDAATGKPVYTNGAVAELKIDEPNGLVVTDADDDTAHMIRARYAANLETLSSHDVGVWLVRLTRATLSLRLRDSGGIYFVPRDLAHVWRQYVAALRRCSSHKVFEIPAMQTEEAVEAILDSLTREADEVLSDVEQLLTDREGNVGTKTKNASQRKCSEMERKLTSYEALLGIKLNAVRERITNTSSAITAAALASVAE